MSPTPESPTPKSHTPESLFRDLAELAPDAMIAVDANGCVIYANRYAHTLFGYAPGTLRGVAVESVIPERSRVEHVAHRHAFAATPQLREMGNRLVPLYGLRRDGTEFRAEVRLSPIRTDQGLVTAAAIRDATEHDRVMGLLSVARETAEKANDAKSRFVAAVSHDLRQPLQTLRIINATLRRQTSDDELQTLLQQEQRSLDAMSDLLNALLSLSKLESGTIKPNVSEISLASVLDDLRQQFDAPAAAKGLRLATDTDGETFVRTDRALFGDLLQNLVSNAIRYTDTGNVGVRVRGARDGQLKIDVSDSGIGIAAESLSRIWDDFYQAAAADGSSRRGGTGLGLAIVRRIADILGIAVTVESTLAVGTTFTIDMRNIHVIAPHSERTPKANALTQTQGHKIILIEDDEAVRAAATMYLKLDGHSVFGVGSLREVDALLDGFESAPAIVISDFRLQRNECGADAILRIRAKYGASLPAIVLTGDVSAVPAGLFDNTPTRLLDKPVDMTSLTNTIDELLGAQLRTPP